MPGLKVRKLSPREAAATFDGVSAPTAETYGEILRLPLTSVVPSPNNPRRHFDEAELQELADSISAHGVLQPIVVREMASVSGTRWQIVMGERRWRAAKLAKLSHIPAVLYVAQAPLQAAIVENVQRADLTADEEARAYRALLESGMTQAQVGKAVGVSQSRVAHRLKLLELPEAVQAEIREGRLSGAHGEVLGKWAEFPEFTETLAGYAIEEKLSARQIGDVLELLENIEDERFEDLVAFPDREILERANCRTACPWQAYRSLEDGRRETAGAELCFRPGHLREVEHELAQEKKAAVEVSREDAVKAVRAAATAGPPPPPPVLEVGDRVRHPLLGEASVLEAKPHAVLLRGDDGGKEIWVGLNSKGGSQVQVLDGSGATLGEPPPKIPDYNSLPRGTAEILCYAHPLPAPCQAETCACFGRVRYYGETNVGVCTQPSRLKALQTRSKSARTAENKRRHAAAVELLAEAIDAVSRVGVRELAVLGQAVSSRDNTYRPNGTSWAEMWKVAGTRVLRPTCAVDELATVEDAVTLVKALVEAVLLQDLALRFHEQGGRSYGSLAAWYVGESIPEACADDWTPAEKGVDP